MLGIRMHSWNPATPKSLAKLQESAWSGLASFKDLSFQDGIRMEIIEVR